LLTGAALPLGAILHAVVAADEAMSERNGLPPVPLPDGILPELIYRFAMFAILGSMMAVSTIAPFLLGILAARQRILEEPAGHLRLLRLTAFVGIPLSVLGGLPLALAGAGVWV